MKWHKRSFEASPCFWGGGCCVDSPGSHKAHADALRWGYLLFISLCLLARFGQSQLKGSKRFSFSPLACKELTKASFPGKKGSKTT